jgi:hypothetical protein
MYQVDTQIQINGKFYNVGKNVLADPTVTTLFVEDPSGNVIEYGPGPPVTRNVVGVYYMLFVPTGPGEWTYQWQGTGAVIATSPATKFFVKASDLIAA